MGWRGAAMIRSRRRGHARPSAYKIKSTNDRAASSCAWKQRPDRRPGGTHIYLHRCPMHGAAASPWNSCTRGVPGHLDANQYNGGWGAVTRPTASRGRADARAPTEQINTPSPSASPLLLPTPDDRESKTSDKPTCEASDDLPHSSFAPIPLPPRHLYLSPISQDHGYSHGAQAEERRWPAA